MTTSHIPIHFRLSLDPVADPAAIVRGPHVRFTVLTSRLIRMETSPDDVFEDHASQAFWFRCQPVPPFQVAQSPEQIEITTEHLRLRYTPNRKGFTRNSLLVELLETGVVWRYGDRDRTNLRGTARTLDQANGPVRLEQGLMSRTGWAVVDDSATLVFNADSWLEPRGARSGDRPEQDCRDLYFFGYGRDYLGCLADFCQVAGPMPLIPRWALGNWWSRYWEYTQAELTGLMAEFRAREVPLAVCVVDMDWHITETGNACSGWTGYTWNRQLFPDPNGLLRWLAEQGLKVTFNLHPAEGVHPHEAQYPEMARRMGIDPASGEPVPFDLADPQFTQAYFDLLHHPMEADGVDFWWLDWQQGVLSKLPGLDPLWWLNHLHYLDLGRDGVKRPFLYSRWGGLGNHRYQIGFSGDTIVAWESLAFQPYFTATAANVGYGWWSHDIGGHQRGIEDAELYVRWVQWGVFSPIFRLHSTKNPFHERRPWGWDAETFRITRDAMQLRHSLIPYLYAMARRCATDSRPVILPMYYLHGEDEAAYNCPDQYYFGSELIAAPYTAPRDPDTRLARQMVWLPAGDWFDFFTGQHYTGGRWQAFYGGLDEIPVLAKAGAIVPLGPQVGWGAIGNPDELTVTVFPGAGNRFDLYEDDGETQAYQVGKYAITPLAQTWRGDELTFTIGPAAGDLAQIPAARVYRPVIRAIRRPDEVRLTVNGAKQIAGFAYDEATETLTLDGVSLRPADRLALTLSAQAGLLAPRDRRLETCRELLRTFRLETEAKRRISDDLPAILAGRASLMRHSRDLKDAHLAALQSALSA
ncbi:MAG: DUF5110 domain-containing protein [Chloroflexi bacterium]|nr:DUF5110 domain-containing protein [Chloroflexota bacterium]